MLEFLWLDVAREMERGWEPDWKRWSRPFPSPFSHIFGAITIRLQRAVKGLKHRIGVGLSNLGHASESGRFRKTGAVAPVAGVIVERDKQL